MNYIALLLDSMSYFFFSQKIGQAHISSTFHHHRHHHHVPEGLGVFLFLDPKDEVGPSISFSVVLCSFVLLVYIVVLALVVCLCPSPVHVVATLSGTVLFPLLCSVLPFFAQYIDFYFPKCQSFSTTISYAPNVPLY